VREVGSPGARTRIETLVTLGRKPELAPNEDLMEGVNAGRKTIPFARFDAKRCAQGLESLRAYRTEWDEKARAFKKTPDHNWASPRRGRLAIPVALVASTDAQAGAGEGPRRHSLTGSHDVINLWTSKTAGRGGEKGSDPPRLGVPRTGAVDPMLRLARLSRRRRRFPPEGADRMRAGIGRRRA
jgi:hypothetical protein